MVSGWGTNDHNLNAGMPGTGDISGTPIFVGGAMVFNADIIGVPLMKQVAPAAEA